LGKRFARIPVKPLTSRANPLFRGWRELARSGRKRREQGLTLIDGIHLVESYLRHGGSPREVLVAEGKVEEREIAGLLRILPSSPVMLADRLFEELTELSTPTGILAVIEIPRARDDCQGSCALLLEDVQDPGNVGSILRTAAAAGAQDAWLSKGCADPWSPKVLRGAMGAHFALRIHERNDLVNTALRRSGLVVALLADAPRPLYELDLTGSVAFALGNEGTGLSPALREVASEHAAIPMHGGVESLGVGAAAAVCLFERARQVAFRSQNAGIVPRSD
jgi:TrmH family RNA methyltransferase